MNNPMVRADLYNYASLLDSLHSMWQPHPSQKLPLSKVFKELLAFVFLECGRKWGKSEFEAYILWRWAMTRPGGYYYFAPFQKQAREILWAPRRLQNFGPKELLAKKPNDTEMRINFKNGSFIKVDGSDNFDAYRGINPHGIVNDEFKDFRPEFWVAMEPNLASFKAQAVFAGTPPEVENEQFENIARESKLLGGYFSFPSWANPHIDKDWLRNKRSALYSRNEGVIWEREYGGRRVFGGPGAIIPMFDRSKHVIPHEQIMDRLSKDKHKLIWLVTADPGTATTFAVLFSAINPYTQEIFHLDCLYIEDQADTTTSRIVPMISEVREGLYPNWDGVIEWTQVYDEAATWFCIEALTSFDEPFIPTHKAQNKKEDGLSLIKDQCINAKAVLSDRCDKLAWEIENYVRDKNGKIPKLRDHLIDCWRYANAAAGLCLADSPEPKNTKTGHYRAFTVEKDLEAIREEIGQVEISETDFVFPDMEFTQ